MLSIISFIFVSSTKMFSGPQHGTLRGLNMVYCGHADIANAICTRLSLPQFINDVQVDRIVEVPVEKIVREYVEVPTDVVVKHEVPITVENVNEVLVTRDVVREVHTDRVIKEQVPFPNDRVVDRVVEVEVETLVDNPVEVNRLEGRHALFAPALLFLLLYSCLSCTLLLSPPYPSVHPDVSLISPRPCHRVHSPVGI
jgi:hypothetical protein